MSGATFKFIDLFAGIGGFHLAMCDLGGECVFASEWDKWARKTYLENHFSGSPDLFKGGMFKGDITKVSPEIIPDFDVLCAGFPCQPFSNAGKGLGFEDTRGTLFFDIARIVAEKKPRALFLENVRGLLKHNNGETFETIRKVLEDDLGYTVHHKIVKASDHGLPQARARLFIVAMRDGEAFDWPSTTPLRSTMSDVLGGECPREVGFTLRVGGRGSGVNDRRNWDCYMVDGQEVALKPAHGLKMQGFPDWFTFSVSETQAMKQLGNSVAVDAIRAVGGQIVKSLEFEVSP